MKTFIDFIYARSAFNSVIGLKSSGGSCLPWDIPEDLDHFKNVTTGSMVVMGSGTWESLPASARPLKKRLNVVVSSKSKESFPENVIVITPEKIADWLENYCLTGTNPEIPNEIQSALTVNVIGGKQLFESLVKTKVFEYIRCLNITEVFDSYNSALHAADTIALTTVSDRCHLPVIETMFFTTNVSPILESKNGTKVRYIIKRNPNSLIEYVLLSKQELTNLKAAT